MHAIKRTSNLGVVSPQGPFQKRQILPHPNIRLPVSYRSEYNSINTLKMSMGSEFDPNNNKKFVPFLKERDFIGRLITKNKLIRAANVPKRKSKKH